MEESIKQLQDLLRMLMEKVDNLETGQEQLKQALFNDILDPINKGRDEANFQDFKDEYGYELDPYAEQAKAVEGDDNYDLYRDVYEGTRDFEGEEKDRAVELMASQIADKIDSLREKLGLAPNTDVTITSDGEGNAQVEIEGEKTEEVSEVSDEVKEDVSEDTAAPEEEEIEDKLKVEETEDDGTEDDEAVLEELRKYKNK